MYSNGNYLDAIKYYKKSSFWVSEKDYNKAYIEYGNTLKEKNNCEEALSYYKKGNLSEESEEITYCNVYLTNEKAFENAEREYEDGNLSKAKKLFEEIDNDFEYNKIKVSDRIKTLNDYSKFVNLTGEKSGSDGYMEVRHIYKKNGSWDSWYGNYSSIANVKCIIQEDGSVKISIVANFYSYTKWSSLSYGLGEKTTTAYFTVTVNKDDNLPSGYDSYPALKAPSGEVGYAELTYSNGKFSLNFTLDDINYSTSFRNKYTSKISYS